MNDLSNDLKCCGNCSLRNSVDMGDCVQENCKKKKITASHLYCTDWQYDGLCRELRIINEK